MSKGLRLSGDNELAAMRAKIDRTRVGSPGRKEAQDGLNRATTAAVALAKVAKRNKFGNTPTDGKDSKREARRGDALRLLEQAGEISELREQIKFVLIPRQDDAAGKCLFRAVTYTLDYQYRDRAGTMHYEDVKGYPNDRFPMKRALMYRVHGVFVEVV